MSRTPEQIQADYLEFRGRCKEFAEAAIAFNPSLRLVRGYYFCPIWNTEEQHWWCEAPDGTVVDPTARQFPSNGLGIYREFDGTVECANCGKVVPEAEASFESRYAFCSYECHGHFVGVL